MTAKQLREQRAPLAGEIRRLADLANAESREFTAEEQAQWEKINKAYDALSGQIARAERAEDIEAEQAKATDRSRDIARAVRETGIRPAAAQDLADSDRARTLALGAWFRSQLYEEPTPEQAEACQQLGFNPYRPSLTLSLLDTEGVQDLQRRYRQHHPTVARDRVSDYRATLSQQVGASGGYLVAPTQMVSRLEVNLLAFGGMRQVAETITTTSGEPMTWPTANDTSNTGAQLGESTSIGTSVDPSFALVRWDAYKFSSKPILVPYELLEDAVFNLPTVLGDMLGERLGRITNTRYTTGTGAGQPKGLVVASTLGVTAASATAITADELIDLFHSVDPAYRNGAGWMCHDGIVQYLRKLKDGNGNYLWQSGLQQGQPDRILGGAVTLNQDMQSTVATGTKTLLFGQLSKYKIRRVNGLRLYRLQERYRDTDQDAFLAFVREDGNLLDAGTAPVKHLLQA